jgi:hypothetical protein
MSKKDFKGGLSSLLGDQAQAKPKIGRPKSNFKEIRNTTEIGTKENESRTTFILNNDLQEKIKAIAYWDRLTIKDVVNSALLEAVAKWQKKNGEVKPIPKK